MKDHTSHQRKIIDGYYRHRDDIMLTRLAEIATDLSLADSPARLTRLWKRAAQAMTALSIPERVTSRILAEKSPELLARHVREWLAAPTRRNPAP